MRQLNFDEPSELNQKIAIYAGEAGPGGASHEYEIAPRDTALAGLATIQFQKGAMREASLNGVSDEALLTVLIDRLRGFQRGEFSCRENALALTKMEEALHWLNARTKDRMHRGVEGRSAA